MKEIQPSTFADEDEEWRTCCDDMGDFLDAAKPGMRARLYEIQQSAMPIHDFSFLDKHAQMLGSVIDNRGGLHEINSWIPFLVLLSIGGGFLAARLARLRRAGEISAVMGVLGWIGVAVLAQAIRSLFR